MELNLENVKINGLFSINPKELKEDLKSNEYKKIENKYILKTCAHISLIGILVILNIINHLTISFPRLTILLISIVLGLITISSILFIRKETLNKLKLLNSFDSKLEKLEMNENQIKIQYKLKDKLIKLKINNITFIEKSNITKYELNLATNTFLIPYQANNTIEYELSNSITAIKKCLKVDIIKKSILTASIFLLLISLIIRNLNFILLISYPICLIFIFITLLIIEDTFNKHSLKEIKNVNGFSLADYNNKEFKFIDNENTIQTLYLENFLEQESDKEYLEINPLEKIIKIPKKS